MRCPKCGKNDKVIDICFNNKDNELYRVRECTERKHIFYTAEFQVEERPKYLKKYIESNIENKFKGDCKNGKKNCKMRNQ